MRYAQITPFEVCNGKGAGVSLFVQGCQFHCKGCFNSDAWDFNGGKEWTEEVKNNFFEIIDKPYIKRVSILGGEPLANQNISEVYKLIVDIKMKFPDKKVWLYTGYTWDSLFYDEDNLKEICNDQIRRSILIGCDVVVDGRYIEALRDVTLKFAGSSNQRVIDVKKSIQENKVVLYG